MDAVVWTQNQIRELEVKVAHLHNTIRGLEEQRRELDEQIGHLQAWLKLYGTSTDGETAMAATEASAEDDAGAFLVQGTIADACAAILRKVGEATTADLTDRLVKVGKVKGENRQTAYATVYGAIQRQPERFKKTAPGRWALTNQLLTDPPQVVG